VTSTPGRGNAGLPRPGILPVQKLCRRIDFEDLRLGVTRGFVQRWTRSLGECVERATVVPPNRNDATPHGRRVRLPSSLGQDSRRDHCTRPTLSVCPPPCEEAGGNQDLRPWRAPTVPVHSGRCGYGRSSRDAEFHDEKSGARWAQSLIK
jgi:hypothetical protein